jgi:hypothetical protein
MVVSSAVAFNIATGLQYGIAPKVSDKAYANGYDLLVHAEESSTLEIVLLRERPA